MHERKDKSNCQGCLGIYSDGGVVGAQKQVYKIYTIKSLSKI